MTLVARRRFNPARIKVLREALGWSQPELAKRLGVSRQAVSLWELGRLEPRINTLVRLVEVTGARIETFLVADEPDTPPAWSSPWLPGRSAARRGQTGDGRMTAPPVRRRTRPDSPP